MSAAGVDEGQGGGDGGESQQQQSTEIEGDVPKPAFELPPEKEEGNGEPAARARPDHFQRRREKGVGYAAEAAAARAEVAQERSERQKLALELAELRGRVSAQQAPSGDPHQAQLDAVAKKIEGALTRMGNGDAAAINEWHQARRDEQILIARHDRETAAREAAASAPGPRDPIIASVVAKYDWLDTDKDARQVAEGIVAKLVRRERRDMSDPKVRKATLMQAAAETEVELEIGGGDNEPTETQRERFRGLGGQNTGAGRASGRTMVALTADQKAQAEALFRNLDPEAAHKEWFNKVGKKIVDK